MDTIKKLKRLDVEADATIELVELNGQQLILKTGDKEEIALDRKFIQVLSKHHAPHLYLVEDARLLPNQLLMEYVPNSPTLDKYSDVEWHRKWGETTRKMHQIISQKCIKIMPDGEEVEIGWESFIRTHISQHAGKHREGKILPEHIIQKVLTLVGSWFSQTYNTEFSLIHGDIHQGNAMIHGDDVVLFDKGSYILYGNRFYDLATVTIDYLGGYYKPEQFHAFTQGYGENFLEKYKKEVELWATLRCFERYPNRFESHSGNVLDTLLAKYPDGLIH